MNLQDAALRTSLTFGLGQDERLSVLCDPEAHRVCLIEGERLELQGKPVLGPGETESQARRVLSGLGPVVVRTKRQTARDSTDIELWVELDPGRWLCVTCQAGRIEKITFGDSSSRLGRMASPMPLDPTRELTRASH